jgi:serine/threonine protein kinase
MLGTTLGRYRILSPLGEGGMGRVFLAEDPVLARRVAIKVLPPEFAADTERRSRLLHEARTASALNHPNILTVHDLGDENGLLYVAMELIEGQTLGEWARKAKRCPADILRLMRQAAGALAVAHAAGLVHRDLKPENLMVREDGLLKILDFGLARSVARVPDGETMAHTMPGTVLGTAPYMSPEQVLGQPAGPPSDVFSMGIMLYELLAGVHPFEGSSPVDTMHRILHESPAPPSGRDSVLPPELDFVVLKALAKEPQRRYATAKELDVDLETCERSLGASPAAAAAPMAGAPRALAVLPFKNIGGNPELNYLGVGLADAVITRLSTSPDLIVRATSSIARYENQPTDPRHVAQELGVTAVLDASFQRAGNRFRATARLVEAPGGQALWAGKVDLDFADIFEVQDQVANGIATALTARLSGEAKRGALVAQRFTPSPEAYELFLRGQEAARSGSLVGLRRAIEVTERAVAIEPGYANAWAFLGNLYHGMTDSGLDPDPRWYPKAEQAFSAALAIDPEHAYAHCYRSMLYLVHGKKREAYRGFVASYSKLPNLWMLHHYAGYLLRLSGMPDECLRVELLAHRMDPSVPWPCWTLARLHLALGRFEAAAEWVERVLTRFPNHPQTLGVQLLKLRKERRFEEAVAVAEQTKDRIQITPWNHLEWAMSLIHLGRLDEARPHVAEAEPAAALDMDCAAGTAAAHAMLGDPDRAFRHLQRAVELGNDGLYYCEDATLFGGLRTDPRWEPFLSGVRERVTQFRREFRWPPA